MEEEKAEEKGNDGKNGFGDNTYWNRTTGRKPRRLPTKYPNLKTKKSNRSEMATGTRTKSRTPSRSPSPTLSHVSLSNVFPRTDPDVLRRLKVSPTNGQSTPPMNAEEERDSKDEKAIVKLMKNTLPQFSNEADWEMAIFELSLVEIIAITGIILHGTGQYMSVPDKYKSLPD